MSDSPGCQIPESVLGSAENLTGVEFKEANTLFK